MSDSVIAGSAIFKKAISSKVASHPLAIVLYATIATAGLASFLLLVNDREHRPNRNSVSPIRVETVFFAPPKTEPESKPEPLPEPDEPEPHSESMESVASNLSDFPTPPVRSAVGSTLELTSDVGIVDGLRVAPLPSSGSIAIQQGSIDPPKIAVFDEWEVDQIPTKLWKPKLNYPRRAERREIEGYVTFRFVVSEMGRAVNIEVSDANPRGFFEEEGQRALEATRFAAATLKGSRVPCRATQTYWFNFDS